MAFVIVVCAALLCLMLGLSACSSAEAPAEGGGTDGTYQVDVTLTGGSGKATVDSAGIEKAQNAVQEPEKKAGEQA